MQAPREQIAAIAEAALSTATGEWAKATTSELVGNVVAEVIGAATSEAISSLAGPLLRTLLRVMERQSDDLRLLLSVPLLTGIREATAHYRDVDYSTELDRAVWDERLTNADRHLAEAITVAEQRKQEGLVIYIWVLRGLIAQRRGASGIANQDLRTARSLLDSRIERLTRSRDELSEGHFRQALRAFASPHIVGSQHLAASMQLADVQSQLTPALELKKYLASLVGVTDPVERLPGSAQGIVVVPDDFRRAD